MDAMLGVATALLARYEPAMAIDYLERAVSIAPTRQHRLSLERARLSYQHRVETRGSSEQFSGATPDGESGDLTVNLRITDRWRVLARGQVPRKFDASEERSGAGVEWRWKPGTTLRVQAVVAQYEYQWQRRDRKMGRVTLLLLQNFQTYAVIFTATAVMSSFCGAWPRKPLAASNTASTMPLAVSWWCSRITSQTRLAPKSAFWPFTVSNTPSEQKTNTSPRSSGITTSSYVTPGNEPSGTPGSSIWAHASYEHRIGYGSPEFDIVSTRRSKSKNA